MRDGHISEVEHSPMCRQCASSPSLLDSAGHHQRWLLCCSLAVSLFVWQEVKADEESPFLVTESFEDDSNRCSFACIYAEVM